MRFYQLSLKEVRELTNEDNEKLWLAIDNLEAQEMLVAMQVAVYPHMKQRAAEKLLGRMTKMAYPEPENVKEHSSEELAEMINNALRR